ncbi:MAG: DUF342 domain-containing protein [Clostridiales bacterium]|jgi:uncharacterized protein (DUF342 family)|nr:DUF342 domain-containing protein [Clostridiales bacterium]
MEHNDSIVEESEKQVLSEEEQSPPPPPVDAVINVIISGDKLEAFLNIEPPENGGAAPTARTIAEALEKNKVTYGIDQKKIQALADKPLYNRDILIAKGLRPVDGEDGSFELLFNTEKKLRPKERADGTVDYQDLGIVNNVRKDDPLCNITLPTDGTEGVAVTGEKLLPKKGKPAPVRPGQNTEQNEQGTVIYSKINGHVVFTGAKIVVNKTFYVSGNVDNSTGSIKVLGNIVIRGTVLSGFTVEAEKNMEINGSVESAKLKAGGNIVLRSGINGSHVTCFGDLSSRFIESCDITVKGSLKSEYIINSNIHCGKNLEISGRRARFSGGSCVVGKDLTCPIIGADSGAKTYLELGTIPEILERQKAIIKELPLLRKQSGSLKQLQTLLEQLEEQNRLDQEKKAMLQEVRHNLESITEKIAADTKELEEINQEIETYGYGKIICRGTIYPGTFIKIGAEKMAVSEPLHNTIVFLSDGEIHSSPAF